MCDRMNHPGRGQHGGHRPPEPPVQGFRLEVHLGGQQPPGHHGSCIPPPVNFGGRGQFEGCGHFGGRGQFEEHVQFIHHQEPPVVVEYVLAQYRYYIITSQLTGFALTVEGPSGRYGTFVVNNPVTRADNQLWYDDFETGTIRSKLNNFCLDVANGEIVVNPYEQGKTSQLWIRIEHKILSYVDQKNGLDVQSASRDVGSKVIVYPFGGEKHQLWDFVYVDDVPSPPKKPPSPPPPPPPPKREEFYIISGMNDKVVEVKDGNAAAGTELCVNPRKPGKDKSQLFYVDDKGFIRSALNDLAFTGSKPDPIKLQPASDAAAAQWKWDGSKITNGNGDVLDICGRSEADGAQLIAYENKDQSNQSWKKEVA